MESNNNQTILNCFSKVSEIADSSKLHEKIFKEIDSQLYEIASYLKTSKLQAFIVVNIYALNYQFGNVGIEELTKYFFCSALKILEWKNDIDYLLGRRILLKELKCSRSNLPMSNWELYISPEVCNAILLNNPIPELKNEELQTETDLLDVLEKLYKIGQMRDDDKILTFELAIQTAGIIEIHQEIEFFAILKTWNCDVYTRYLFIYLCWKFFNGEEVVDLETAAKGIFDKPKARLNCIKEFITKKNFLCKNDWVEVIPNPFINDTKLKITEKGLDLLLGEDKKLFSFSQNNKDVIKPSNTIEKQLFYNLSEQKQLKYLSEVLQNDKLSDLQARLSEKGYPKGITALFYGASGTGKTETVYQFAKKTNREIVHVDISKSKSMWFGESEKIIKKIFENYRKLSAKSSICPILLFNEADAIISKRKSFGYSSVEQTENAIQNIILEELEKFDGILFATTNLVNNFDKAFERRFLFKIEFQKPDLTNRAKIWQTKIPDLSNNEALILSEKFDFSGGQIDNIARKFEISEIVDSIKPDINQLILFCKEETLAGNAFKKIGFKI